MTRRLPSLLLLLVMVLAATGLGLQGGTALSQATYEMLIMLVLVVGLYAFVGISGIFSFGHVALMGVGGYAAAIVSMSEVQQRIQLEDLPPFIGDLQLGIWPAIALGAGLAALVALIVAPPLMRLSGLTASLATVALLIATRVVLQNWETYTRGTRGLILDATRPSLATLLVIALVSIVVAFLFRWSPVGRRLAASREDEAAARAIGVRIWWERGAAWLLSAFTVGAAGALYALHFRNISPDSFYLSLTFASLAMLVVGGLKSLSGAVVGTITLTAILEIFRTVERGVEIGALRTPARPGLTEFGLAAVLLAVLIWRPRGLTGGRELGGGLRWRKHRGDEEQDQTEERPPSRRSESTFVSGSSSLTRSREE